MFLFCISCWTIIFHKKNMAPKGINIFLTYLIVFQQPNVKIMTEMCTALDKHGSQNLDRWNAPSLESSWKKACTNNLFIIFNEIRINYLDIVLLICFIKILGCMRDGRFIPIDSSLTYDKDGIRWTCRCETIDANRQSLKCTGQYI